MPAAPTAAPGGAAGRSGPRAARGGDRPERAGRGDRRRRHRQDPGDHPPDRVRGGHRGATTRPRCWPSPSPPGRRGSCAGGCSSSAPAASRPGPSTPRRCARRSTSGRGSTAASCRRCWTTGCRWWPSRPAGCGSRWTPRGCATWCREISWAKVSNVSAGGLPAAGRRRHRQLASFDPETVARVFAGYERAKRDRGRIDFEDILLCAAALLSEHAEMPTPGPADLPAPGRRRVPGRQPAAAGAARPVARATAPTCAWSATRRRPSTPSPGRRPAT